MKLGAVFAPIQLIYFVCVAFLQTEEHFLFSNRRTREGAADFLELLDISKEKVSHSTIEHNNDAHGHGGEKHETDTGDTSSQKSSVSDGTGAETSQPQEGDSDIVGLCPMNPPEGAAIATTLPSTIKSQFEKLPLILEFSLRNTTTTDIFRSVTSSRGNFFCDRTCQLFFSCIGYSTVMTVSLDFENGVP